MRQNRWNNSKDFFFVVLALKSTLKKHFTLFTSELWDNYFCMNSSATYYNYGLCLFFYFTYLLICCWNLSKFQLNWSKRHTLNPGLVQLVWPGLKVGLASHFDLKLVLIQNLALPKKMAWPLQTFLALIYLDIFFTNLMIVFFFIDLFWIHINKHPAW